MWLPYIDCSDYEVSSDGEIRRVVRVLPRGRRVPYLLGQRTGNSGYLHASISVGGVARNILVHRMVLRTWVGEPPTEQHHAAHINGDRLDNRLANLVWASPAENAAHKGGHGTDHSPRSLTAEAVARMRRIYVEGDISYRKLGKLFGVSAATACGAVTGRYWSHLPGAVASKSKNRVTAHDPSYNKNDNI